MRYSTVLAGYRTLIRIQLSSLIICYAFTLIYSVTIIDSNVTLIFHLQEISGVAFIFNQKFFKELYAATGIDLENIVYYKDETHYFVMTAKKHSLIDKGVILQVRRHYLLYCTSFSI